MKTHSEKLISILHRFVENPENCEMFKSPLFKMGIFRTDDFFFLQNEIEREFNIKFDEIMWLKWYDTHDTIIEKITLKIAS